ncbi:F-box/kelch-repeat protein At3g06240-like [Rosa rugosa]|uniref:F-box/kelch-repeat protein At3g06240-like n=1 Tax=Rosa rugosa TaxID=74645 RepID=UPI002B41122F|nr:F-box/kelch-repeat protein At3g06240-like [Rosa rugosa]
MEDNGELTGHQIPLPAEIMIEILSRLTVKSLCRFRCVSKPWRSLISNKKFIAMHTRKALEDKEVFLGRRRVIFNGPSRCPYSLHLDEFPNHADNHDGLVTATVLDFVYDEYSAGRHSWVPFIYSCNNLLLCDTMCGFYLVNPATREMKKVPKTPSWRPMRLFCMSLCGFGFDYATNEYKVVNGQAYPDIDEIVFSVYTLKTGSWRQIQCPSSYHADSFYGIFLNGAIHWSADTVGDRSSSVIVSFLLAEEEVCEIQLPPIDGGCSTNLGVFRDCLCVTLIGNYNQTFNEFWVMKEYRVSESWTRMRVSMPYQQLLQFGFSTKSHDLMVCDSSFVMYDFRKESCRNLPIRDIPKVGYCTGIYVEGLCIGIYVEGLFPLMDQEQDERCKEDESSIN